MVHKCPIFVPLLSRPNPMIISQKATKFNVVLDKIVAKKNMGYFAKVI